MEADMKALLTMALVTAMIVAVQTAPAGPRPDPAADQSFSVAQRFCPNNRC
jgi:hypothetical protein